MYQSLGESSLPFVLASSSPSLASLLPRLFGSMAVVIAVMWFAARVMRNRQIPGHGTFKLSPQRRNPLQVIARQGVGRHASVTIVRAGEKTLVLGISEQNIALLTELDRFDLADVQDLVEPQGTGAPVTASSNAVSSARTGLLSQIRERTVRRA